jgi:hypothetical protein
MKEDLLQLISQKHKGEYEAIMSNFTLGNWIYYRKWINS